MVKEINNIISKKNINMLLTAIDTQKFPFYLAKGKNKNEHPQLPFLYHQILKRPEDKISTDLVWNTPYAQLFLSIFQDFCKKVKIKKTQLYRACLNLTFAVETKKCKPHRDHEYPYRQVIIYLNNADPEAKTIILNKNNKITNQISPKKNKGVMFDSSFHYHIFPKFGYRIVLIYTFK